MALTKEFKDTVVERAKSDISFRRALFSEAANALFDDDLSLAKALLRDYVNATVGFEPLSQSLNKSPKSLMRMLGIAGNPQAANLFAVINKLQELTEVKLNVEAA